jgi:hypothetical protein
MKYATIAWTAQLTLKDNAAPSEWPESSNLKIQLVRDSLLDGLIGATNRDHLK